jgi:NADH:ubiquinone oxidoreductase subunit 6 (subunit J)
MSTFIIILINIIFFFIIILICILLSAFSSIYALLSLILIAFCIVGLLLILQIEWFGLLLGIIYLGSIIVLFLFVIMLLKIQYSKINYKKLILNLFFFIFFLVSIYNLLFLDIIKFFLKIYIYSNNSSNLFYNTVANNNLFYFNNLFDINEINLYLLSDLFIYFYIFEGGFIIFILLWLLVLVLIGITNLLTLIKDKNIYTQTINLKINKKI